MSVTQLQQYLLMVSFISSGLHLLLLLSYYLEGNLQHHIISS